MCTAKQITPVRRFVKAGRLGWVFPFLILMLGLSCRTLSPQREALSEYYWEVQNLRMQAGKASESTQAWRDLGVIYLRTGHFEEADDVLSRAIAQDRSDPKLWFYAGLTQELLDRQEAALATYEQAPMLSATSLYSQAMKGRIAWLQDEQLRRTLEALLAQDALPPPDRLSPGSYTVFPLVCQGGRAEYADLGKGLSELISRDLDQLRGIDVVEPGSVRKAFERASAMQGRTDMARPVWVGRLLGAGKIVGGTCAISVDDRIEVDLVLRDLIEDRVITVSAQEHLEDVPLLEKNLMDKLIDELRIWLPNRERRIPVTSVSLEALVAYSQGLAREDAGDLEQSAAFYRQALALYPRFTLAAVRTEVVENKILARGADKKDLVDLVVRLESYAVTPYLLDTRLQYLGRSIGSGFIPGQDTRKLPPGNVGELPAPPRPVGNE